MLRVRFFHKSLRVATAAVIVGCGGDDPLGPAIDRNESGAGSATLRVIAGVEVEDESGGGYITELVVTLRDASDAPVSGAVVVISAPGIGAVTVPEVAGSPGDYVAVRQSAATGDIRLDVTRGTDNVTGVVVGSPRLHVITAPARNSTHGAGTPLSVRWTVPTEGTFARIETDDFTSANTSDDGDFEVPGSENITNQDQRIRVFRGNEVTIAGGLAGSRLRVTTRDTIEPVIVQ